MHTCPRCGEDCGCDDTSVFEDPPEDGCTHECDAGEGEDWNPDGDFNDRLRDGFAASHYQDRE